jgi:hypothetical protein
VTDGSERPLRTPLTGRNRVRNKLAVDRRAAVKLGDYLPAQCKQCGATLAKSHRRYCDACAMHAQRAGAVRAAEVSKRRKTAGVTDGRGSESERERKRASALQRTAERQQWEATHESKPNASVFRREIAPRLHRVPASLISEATGLRRNTANAIRRGSLVPHPRHWDALRQSLDAYENSNAPGGDWESLDSTLYNAEIAPRIRELASEHIRAATGLSVSYARRVRFGHHVPHRRHWRALLALIDSARSLVDPSRK